MVGYFATLSEPSMPAIVGVQDESPNANRKEEHYVEVIDLWRVCIGALGRCCICPGGLCGAILRCSCLRLSLTAGRLCASACLCGAVDCRSPILRSTERPDLRRHGHSRRRLVRRRLVLPVTAEPQTHDQGPRGRSRNAGADRLDRQKGLAHGLPLVPTSPSPADCHLPGFS